MLVRKEEQQENTEIVEKKDKEKKKMEKKKKGKQMTEKKGESNLTVTIVFTFENFVVLKAMVMLPTKSSKKW